jgi:Ca2+-binding EF-hand superfamily protein
MKITPSKRLLSMFAAASIAVSGAAFAQQPAPMPAKPEKPAAAPTATAAPTSSQSNDALFKRIDTDTDGSLSKTELEKFDPEAAKSFDKYDADKDSKLSLSEFDAMVKGLRGG